MRTLVVESCPLSERELEILDVVAEGATNAQTAQLLGISVNTVKVHLSNVYAKLGVESRTEATTMAIRCGWIVMEAGADSSREDGDDRIGVDVAGREAWWLIPARVAVLVVIAVGAVLLPFWGWQGLRRHKARTYSDRMVSMASPQRAEADRWALAGPMQMARSRLAVVTYEDSLLAIGGETAEGVTGAVEALSPVVQVWGSLADKPTAVANVSAAVIGGRVFVPGGTDDNGAAVGVLEAYEPGADRWVSLSPMPAGRYGYGLAAMDGKLYLFGGMGETGVQHDVIVYDPALDRWSQYGAWPDAAAFMAVAVRDGTAYLLGGLDGAIARKTCWAFTPSATDPWRPLEPMTAPRAGGAAVALGSRVYVVGGGWAGSLAYSEQYDIDRGTWQPFETPVLGTWRGMGAALVTRGAEEVIYVVGGWDGGYSAQVDVFRPFYYINLPIIP